MKTPMVLAVAMCAATAATVQAGGAHWGYAGDEGPAHWAELSPDYAACAGRNQSPVNLTGFTEASLAPITFRYEAGGTEVINNGHTVQVNYAPGSSIQVDGRTFKLLQFHFHAPSENRINGRAFPMEAHFVHADEDGNLAVVAVMFEEGAENPALAPAWSAMPAHAGGRHALVTAMDAAAILPRQRGYYRYNGSLTTPPCTEGVRWLVMKQPVTASRAQIAAFRQALHGPNNRPVQPLHARVILK